MNDFSNLRSIIYQMTEILKTDPSHEYWTHTFKNLFNNPDLHNRPDDFKKQGADPDNSIMRYHGKYAKESFKYL